MGDLPQLQGLRSSWKWLIIAMSRYYNSPCLRLEAIKSFQNLPIPRILPWDHICCYFPCCSVLYIEYPKMVALG